MSSEVVTYLPKVLGSTSDGKVAVDDEIERIPDSHVRAPSDSVQKALLVNKGTDVSDEDLLEQVSRGARASLALLFRRHAVSVRVVARRILRDDAEADDLLQEVFLLIFRKASLFDPAKGSARSWIFHLTYHHAFNRRRYLALRHFYTHEDIEEHHVSAANTQGSAPIDLLAGKELLEKFEHHLSKEQRQTVYLYFIEGYSLREISERTAQSLGNVRNHYYRGLDKLRRCVRPK